MAAVVSWGGALVLSLWFIVDIWITKLTPREGMGGWLGLEIVLTEQINYHQEMPPNI